LIAFTLGRAAFILRSPRDGGLPGKLDQNIFLARRRALPRARAPTQEHEVKNFRLLFASVVLAAVMPAAAFAACPANVGIGQDYCRDHSIWKCEKCGSEYCEIIQSGKCLKDDPRDNLSDISRLVKRVMASARDVPAYSPRQ
jgi:hypothetical protein